MTIIHQRVYPSVLIAIECILLVSCKGSDTGDVEEHGTDTGSETEEDTARDGGPEPNPICEDAREIPLTPEVWLQEDHLNSKGYLDGFTFDGNGDLIARDKDGALYRLDGDGKKRRFAEDLTKSPRAAAFLSTGELIVADSELGTLLAIMPDDKPHVLARHLDMPSAVEVDNEDFIYVSEQLGRAVLRIDPKSGEKSYLVRHMDTAPGGLSFSPDFRKLYIAGYGDGTIWVLEKDSKGRFGDLKQFATVPGGAGNDLCKGKSPYDTCRDLNIDLGVCTPDADGGIYCQRFGACDDKDEGAVCLEPSMYTPGNCKASEGGSLFCDPAWACTDKSEGDACVPERRRSDPGEDMVDAEGVVGSSSSGRCVESDIGLLFCEPDETDPSCNDKEEGDECVNAIGQFGVCEDAGDGSLVCTTDFLCDSASEGDVCTNFEGLRGVCLDEGEGYLYCEVVGTCGQASPENGDCYTAYGDIGRCVAVSGVKICEEVYPCEGKNIGDECTSYDGQKGVCTDSMREPEDSDGAAQAAIVIREPDTGQDDIDMFDTEGGEPYFDLYCKVASPCDGKAEGDNCVTTSGNEGRCKIDSVDEPDIDGGVSQNDTEQDGDLEWEPESYLYCAERPPCEDAAPGDSCKNEEGEPGVCVEDSDTGKLKCDAPLPCVGASEGERCRENGVCVDFGDGTVGCQESSTCDFEGAAVGDFCFSADVSLSGECVKGESSDVYCRIENPCRNLSVGDACFDRDRWSFGVCEMSDADLIYCRNTSSCEGKAEADPCITNWGSSGLCFDMYGDGLQCEEVDECYYLGEGKPCQYDVGVRGICELGGEYAYCSAVRECDGLGEGDACVDNDGNRGLCFDFDIGDLVCGSWNPCDGAATGQTCNSIYGQKGKCRKDGSMLYCDVPRPCDDAEAGDACIDTHSGEEGKCEPGLNDTLICQPKSPCKGKDAGDSCGSIGRKGICIDTGGGGELWCFKGTERGLLQGIGTDACGNVYVSDVSSDGLWRFSPDGETSDLIVASPKSPITGFGWGSGKNGWGRETLYLNIEGQELVKVDLDYPGRDRIVPKSGAEPQVDPDLPAPEFDCINLPDEPVTVKELDIARGYHGLAFDDEGYVIGFDDFNLVRAPYDASKGSVQLYATGVEDVQGMDWLPDGSLIVATGSDVVRIAPNGGRSVLAAGISGYGVRTDPRGRVWVGDNSRLYRIEPETKHVEVMVDPSALGESYSPRGVEFDPDFSVVYITTLGDSDIYVAPLDDDLDLVASPTLFATIPGSSFQDGIAMDVCGNLYVPVYDTSSLYRINREGEVVLFYDFGEEAYGHSIVWGSGVGGFSDTAVYLPQPYDENTVIELELGYPSRTYWLEK